MIDKFTGEYRFLSNFYPLKNGTTVEHLYQSNKALYSVDKKWIMEAPTPGEAKRRGRIVKLDPYFTDYAYGIMETLLRNKFKDPELKQMLLNTRDEELIEGNTWGDTYWGVCDGEGYNHLGRLLMQIREECKNE